MLCYIVVTMEMAYKCCGSIVQDVVYSQIKGAGPVATVVVERGTVVVAGPTVVAETWSRSDNTRHA